ncbi:MAG: hypothetical protein CM15mV25_0480 [uncultured marine virus]|nr:MAG: hypothetical protein CM15mV25_0480 [uncultured marine virus]
MNNYNVVLKTPNYFKYVENYPVFKKEIRSQNTMFKAFNGTPTKG